VVTYPTIVLLTSTADVLGRITKDVSEGEDYFERITALEKAGRKALDESLALEDALNKAKGDARFDVLKNAIARLGTMQPGAPGLRPLLRIAHRAFAIDLLNKHGLLHSLIETALAKGLADRILIDLVRIYDPDTQKGLQVLIAEGMVGRAKTTEDVLKCADELDRLKAAGFSDRAKAIYLFGNVARWLFKAQRVTRARKFAQYVMDLHPPADWDGTKDIQQILGK
jgi:hypothetical protein